MNTVEYIASGILEQYVSGTASAQEKQEVECMSHIYPEIKAELLSLQNTFEALALSMSTAPPAHLRDSILDSIRKLAEEEKQQNQNTGTQTETDTLPAFSPVAEIPASNVVSMPFPLLKIAATVFFLLSTALAYLYYQDVKQNDILSNDMALLKKDMQQQLQMVALQTAKIKVMDNPDFKKVVLAGIREKSPNSTATVYWNPKSSDVYIAVDQLPAAAPDKQYQLWAIADGKPVDMGMLGKANTDSIFQKMKTISNASAFAITLEKEGGVPSPTMTEMYVMGGI